MKNYAGNFTLTRQPKPSSRWKTPGVREFDPNWVVRFRVPGFGTKVETARLYPVCRPCMECAESPTVERPGCKNPGCQKDVTRWAELRLAEMVGKARAGELAPTGTPKIQRLSLAEVLPVYLEHGPEQRFENVRALRLVVESPSGKALEKWFLDELTPAVLRLFVRCYQEYARRWRGEDAQRGTAEERAARWAELRGSIATLPPIDLRTITTSNTTIVSELQKARAVIGHKSRSVYVTCFDGRWPDLREWEDFTAGVPRPDNKFSLSHEVYQRMCEGLPLLKKPETLAMWTALRIMWRTGIRPIELIAAETSWLEKMTIPPDKGEEGPCNQVVILVVKNRADFAMKNWRTKQERAWPLDAETMEGVRTLARPGSSILGLAGAFEGEELLRSTSAWLRACGVEGSHTNYNLRKLVGTVVVARDGAEAGARALGHGDSAVTMKHYAGTGSPLRVLTDSDLTPASVMGGRREPWAA